MERLKKIEEVVEIVLRKKEEARNSDDYLYYCVCEYFSRGVSKMTLGDFLRSRESIGCPTYESVSRARRKVFADNPELKPIVITEKRKEMEDVYRDYAVN